MDFATLFLRHGAASHDKQIYLQAMLGKAGWAFDLNSGVLAFRRPHEAPLQLAVQAIGTESEDTGTWLWSWANESALPPSLVASALQLKRLGEVEGIPEFTTSELKIAPTVNPGRISLVASGVLRASAYFRAPYPRGALYLLIKDPKYKRSVTQPVQRVVKAFPLFLARYFVADQRAAFMHYLRFYRLHVREDGRAVRASSAPAEGLAGRRAQRLVAEFDDANRLAGLRLSESPEP
jgi:hypothetical protein